MSNDFIKKELDDYEYIIESYPEDGKINTVNYLNTYFTDLDMCCNGIEKNDLIILAGRSGMGKTSLALNVITNICLHKHTGIYFSLKDSRKQIVDSLISSEAEVSSHHLKVGNVAKESWKKIANTFGQFLNIKLNIFDSPSLYLAEIEEKIISCKENNFDDEKYLVVIDDLQMLSEEKYYVETCRQLKILTKKLNVPIILLSQVDPWVDKRNNKRPKIADLDYQGNISNYADKIWMLYRDEYYNPESLKYYMAELIVEKNKNGPIGTVELYFDRSITKFSGLEH